MSSLIGNDALMDGETVVDAQKEAGSVASEGISSRSIWQAFGWLACGVVLVYIYHEVLRDLWVIWWNNQDYSHGLLVVPFAAFLVWRHRNDLMRLKQAPSLIGAAVLLAALGLRVFGVRRFYGSAERYSLIVAVWGVVLLLGGSSIAFKRTPGKLLGWRPHLMAAPMLFLLLMIPPPARVVNAITLPLQRLAALTSAWILSVIGWDAISEGNIIRMPGQSLGVAAACNGLRMVYAIVFLACAMPYLARRLRPWWERATVACSSVIIGIAANAARIVATGVVSQVFVGSVSASRVHDIAGWLMMPLALMLIWGEQRFLTSLFIDE